MNGIDFTLKHQVAMIRHQELIAEAARQRRVDEFFATRAHQRQNLFAEVRATVANALFRTANWLMPEDSREQAPHGGFELRPSR